jgi:integrase
MENRIIDELIETAIKEVNGFNLTDKTLRSYHCRAFHPIKVFFAQKNETFYDDSLINELKEFYQSQLNEGKLSLKTYNWRLRGLAIIKEVYQTGTFKWKVISKKKKKIFSKFFEETIESFIKSLGTLKRKDIYESVVRRFVNYLNLSGYRNYDNLSSVLIRGFLIEISSDKPKSMDDVVIGLRKFFKYLEINMLTKEPCYLMLSAPRSRDKKVYSSIKLEEFNRIISSIDLNYSPGKRNYAVLMLAATTGLRPGDIASLKLSDINWKAAELSFIQGKTNELLILPLDKITCNAIADYILCERPSSTSNNIFLRSYAPFNQLHDGVSISCIFRKYLKAAGIVHKPGDGKTMSGLRRMLATEMIAEGTPITTASQILGHKTKGTIKQYISLDINGLKKCTLGFDSLEVYRDE